MDPNAILQEILESIERNDPVGDLFLELNKWLSGGGFLPDAWTLRAHNEDAPNENENRNSEDDLIKSGAYWQAGGWIRIQEAMDKQAKNLDLTENADEKFEKFMEVAIKEDELPF
jgi:hypothetical protein